METQWLIGEIWQSSESPVLQPELALAACIAFALVIVCFESHQEADANQDRSMMPLNPGFGRAIRSIVARSYARRFPCEIAMIHPERHWDEAFASSYMPPRYPYFGSRFSGK
jgi:hypothetical protein